MATITGTGCPAGSTVTLLIDGDEVATARAGRAGGYETQARLGDLAVGRHPLEARCDPVRANSSVDVVVPSAAVGTAASTVTTAIATFAFFVLLGGQLLR